jgi:hypothetical protein
MWICECVGRPVSRFSDNPCDKNPCQNIARAMVDTCQPVGHSDFECRCQPPFTWDDDSNSCLLSQYLVVKLGQCVSTY